MRPIHFLQGPQTDDEVRFIPIIDFIVDPEVPEVREVDSVNSLDGDYQVPTDHQSMKDGGSNVLDVLQDGWIQVIV